MPTMFNIATGKSLPGTPTQSLADQGWVVASSANTTPPPTVTRIESNPVGYQAQLGSLQNYQSMYQGMLSAQQKALEAQYNQRVGEIGSSYTAGAQQIQDTGARIGGSLRRILGRAGSFTTSSGATAVANQEQSILNQTKELGAARDQALNAAMVARQNGESALYEKNLTAMYNIQKQIMDIYQQEQARQDKLAEKEEAKVQANQDMLNKIGMSGYTYVPTPAERDRLKALGYDLIQVEGKTYAKPPDKTAAEEEWLAYKRDGGNLSFNDYQTMDANRKRSVSVTNNYGASSSDQDQILDLLNKSKGDGQDGRDTYWNTKTYTDLRSQVKDKTNFDKTYSWNLNPNDPTAQAFISGKNYTATTIPPSLKQMLLDDVTNSDATEEELKEIYTSVSSAYIHQLFEEKGGDDDLF